MKKIKPDRRRQVFSVKLFTENKKFMAAIRQCFCMQKGRRVWEDLRQKQIY